MAGNTARLAGGALAAAILATIVIALLPRLVPQTAVTEAAPATDAAAATETAVAIADPVPETTAPAAAEPAAPSGPTVDTYLLGPDGVAVVAGHAVPGSRVTVMLDGTPLAEVVADASGSFAATAEVTASDLPRSLTFAVDGGPASGDAVLVRPGTGAPAAPVADEESQIAMAEVAAPPAIAGEGDAAASGSAEAGATATGSDDASVGTEGGQTASAGVQAGPAEDVTDTAARQVSDTTATADTSDTGTAPAETATAEEGATAAEPSGETATAANTVPVQDTAGSESVATASDTAPAARTPATDTTGIASTDAGAAPATDRTQPPAPTIVVDDEGARVLGPGPQVMDRVALDAITYDAEGGVQLAGRAPGDGMLQVYVDNRPVTTGPVGAKGDWRLTLPDVDPGTYTLRIDELAADGTVASRVETPFRREAAADVAALQAGEGGRTITTRTVQPGNTLWAIARENFGDGFLYVRVFEANADQIRDPDLIYPGQVFVIPDGPDTGAYR